MGRLIRRFLRFLKGSERPRQVTVVNVTPGGREISRLQYDLTRRRHG